MLQRFSTIQDMIRTLRPEESTYCICQSALEENARAFLEGFPGEVLYAIKANPMREVFYTLYNAGITHFDTASVSEISAVSRHCPEATAYFMHPVKGWQAISDAYHDHGVRHYAIDHIDEIHKMASVLEGVEDLPVLVIRLSTPGKDATFNLSEKFGVDPDEAVMLLREASVLGFPVGVCFHVGSQCLSTDGYEAAFDLTARVLSASNVSIRCLDVGGGFPAAYESVSPPPLNDFLEVIKRRVGELDLPEDCRLMCEPGRALVANAMAMVAQVQLRRGDTIYINDGIYGTLGGTKLGLRFPVRACTSDGLASSEEMMPFSVFGPTCDSLDVLPYKPELPASIAMGDWLVFGMQGAYGPATRTEFNGFRPSQYCYVDEPFS